MASGVHLAALSPYPVDRLPADLAGGVVAIGNFDGVHRGHVALLEAAQDEAARRGVPSLVLTFEPHPRTVLRPDAPVFRLTPLAAKARILKAVGMDGLAVATFDRAFAAMTPDEFVAEVLVARMRIAAVVVGFNFRFGKARAGGAATLGESGRRLGFGLTVVEAVADPSGTVLASSAIRAALAEGDVAAANRLLGYSWLVMGTVARGEGRGHEIGFPTANIALADTGLRHGIYVVRVQRPGGAIHDGVASFGVRPTFGAGAPLLEVHVFDFQESLYGEEVAVSFLDWIRPELKFSGIDELVAAIREDAAAARAFLTAAGAGTALDQRLAALP